MKKLALGLTAALLALSTLAATAPADATSWGCGGACRHAGR